MADKQSTAASQTVAGINDASEYIVKLGIEEVNAIRRALAEGLCYIAEVERIRSAYNALASLGAKARVSEELRPFGNEAHVAIDHISTAITMLDGINDADAGDASEIAAVPSIQPVAPREFKRMSLALNAFGAELAGVNEICRVEGITGNALHIAADSCERINEAVCEMAMRLSMLDSVY